VEIDASEFGLKLNNIPIMNLRTEFVNNLALLADKKFQAQCQMFGRPIETPYLTWFGMPDTLLTILLQRAILGFESYVTDAAYQLCGEAGRLTPELAAKLRNPFSLGGGGTADNYFNRMPALVDTQYQLKVADAELWETTRRFYTVVRNPLFHGNEVDMFSIYGVLRSHQHIDRLYWWVDGWYHPEKVVKGFSALSKRVQVEKRDDA
jgi:hypothetical protein